MSAHPRRWPEDATPEEIAWAQAQAAQAPPLTAEQVARIAPVFAAREVAAS